MKTTHKPIFALGIALLLIGILPGFAATVSAVNGGAPPARPVDLVYHDDVLWDSVVLGPLHGNPKPTTLDAFYMIPGQAPVAGAGPGDRDYNGGRWQPTMVAWVSGGAQPLFTDGDAVEAALAAGDLVVTGSGAPFLCPLTNPNNS
ncbi:MAG: hypothetical protein ACE5LS_07300 [Thermoplasmata archaeon]